MKRFILMCLALSCLQGTVLAQGDEPGAKMRRFSAILKDIRKTESAAYKRFNLLNSSDDFDIVCYQFTATGSKVRQRVCEPKFLRDARKRDASRFMTGSREGTDTAVPQLNVTLQAMMQDEITELRREVQTVAQQDAEFRAQLQTLQELAREYAAHERSRGDDGGSSLLLQLD